MRLLLLIARPVTKNCTFLCSGAALGFGAATAVLFDDCFGSSRGWINSAPKLDFPKASAPNGSPPNGSEAPSDAIAPPPKAEPQGSSEVVVFCHKNVFVIESKSYKAGQKINEPPH